MLASTAAVRSASNEGVWLRALTLTWLLACAMGAIAVLLMVGAPVAHAEPFCTDTWIGPAEGNWATATDWSAGVPTFGTVACVGSADVVTVSEGAQEASTLVDAGGLTISGGSLTLDGSAETSSVNALSLSGSGVLTGSGSVDVTGSMTANGGAMHGSGTTVLQSATTALVKGSGLTLSDRKLTAQGSMLVEGKAAITGEAAAQISNSGTMTVNSEGAGSGLVAGAEGPAPSLTIASGGTLRKSEGTGTTQIGFVLDNEGTVAVTSTADLEFTAGGSSGREHVESWSVANKATIVFAKSNIAFGADTAFSGEGYMLIREGVDATATVFTGTEKTYLSVLGGTFELTGAKPRFSSWRLATESGSWISGNGATVTCSGEIFVGERMTLGENTSIEAKEVYVGGGSKRFTIGAGSTINAKTVVVGGGSGSSGEFIATGALSVHTEEFSLRKQGIVSGPVAITTQWAAWEKNGTLAGGGSLTTSHELIINAPGSLLTDFHVTAYGEVSFGKNFSGEEGSFEMSDGAVFENKGVFRANSQSPGVGAQVKVAAGSTTPPKLVNRGEFLKTEGEGTTEISVPFENSGLVRNTSKGHLIIDSAIVPSIERQYGPENHAEKESRRASCGDPVDCVTGNFTETETDLAVGGRGVGLDLTRYYNAQAAAAGQHGIFGYGWSSSFNDHLEVNTTTHTATVVQANGSTVTFTEEGKAFKSPVWSQYTLTGSSVEGYVLTTTNKTVYKFAGTSGRLESVTNPNGNVSSLGYNEKGQLATITDPASRTIKFAYNTEGLVESATDPMGHVVKYTYESGNLASVTMPGESSARWKFKYDASHRMTSMVNGLGGETKNIYDEANQVTSQTEPTGHTIKWEYEGFRTLVTNEATKAVTLYEYDSEDQLTEVAHGYGSSSETRELFTYDEAGSTITKTDGDGHTTSYEYDGEGNRIKQTDPEGHETKWTYNGRHQVTSETLPGSEKTTTEYDEHGNPIKVSRPAPKEETQETRYEYNAAGEMTAMIDPLSRKWTYEYDAYGDKKAEIDPEGDKRTWKYNEDSLETSTTSPRGNVEGAEASKYTTTIERDAQGRTVKVTEPEAAQGKPVSRMRAVISGETLEGQTLTATPGVWEGTPSLSYAYQWERCGATGLSCAVVSGATSSTYALASVDVGHTIRVVVSATNSSGSASSTSAVTAVVSAALMPHYASLFGSKGSGAGQLAHPYGIALDSHGNVWVSDGENNRVEEFSSTGTFIEAIGWGVSNGESKYEVCTSGCRAGIKGSGEGQFNEPAGVTFSGGNLYVVDYGNDRVEEFNEKIEFVRAFGEKGTGAGQLEGPETVAAAPSGNIWVSDTKNRRIEEFSSTGVFVETIGWGVSNGEAKYEVCTSSCHAGIQGSGSGEFNTPVGVAFDGSNLYVVDNVNDRVEEFNEKSEYVTKFGAKGKEAGQFEEATNIGVEASTGDLYVNDWGDDRIEQFTSAGGFVGQFGGLGTNGGQFSGPQGIVVTSTGSVDVVDDGNDRVQEFKPISTPVSVFAPPNVSGEMIEGQVITAGTGFWAASPAASYTYQWQRCSSAGVSCLNIAGASSATYTIASADTGHELRVQVTAKNTAGSTTASSNKTQTLAGPHMTKYAYDAEGQLESETNAEGQTTTTTYNTAGLPIKVSYAGGQSTETEYDGAGQVVAQTDGNKHTTKYVRNVLEQVTEVIDPLSRKTKKTYDRAGNLATLTDPEGRVTTYGYNKENQLTKASYSDKVTPTVEYAYTVNGQRESMSDGTGTTSYTYDQLGRLTETKDGHGDKVAYAYDLANETTQITYPNGKNVKYSYDKAGRMSSLSDWLSHTTSFGYNADSQLAATTFPEASGESDHYAYTPSGLMSEASFQKGTETLASLIYARNNVERLTRTAQTGLPGEAAIEDSYDQNERLTTAGTTSYEYDAANNPTKQGTATYTYNAGDELEAGGGNTYSYNEEGQHTKTTPASGPAITYGYNQAGNLTTANRPEEGTTTKIEDTYTNNGDGLRTAETTVSKTSYLTWQLASGLPLLLNDNTNSYIYGPEDIPIEQISNEEHATYLHHDQQGSTRLLTNEKGETTGKCSYNTYGTPTCEGTTTTPLGYDSQYTSNDTGLIYLRARAYDPATAQFLTVDPLVAATRAVYDYAGDNPLNNGDPTGLAWQGCVGITVSVGLFSFGGEACYVSTPEGSGIAATGSVTAGAGYGANVHAGGGVSNACRPSEYGGPFAQTGGSAEGYVGGYGNVFTNAPVPGHGRTVVGATGGVTAGWGVEGGAGGSETVVVPFSESSGGSCSC